MKRLFATIISAIMVLSMSASAFAANTITEQNGSKQMDVQAKAVYTSPENMYAEAVSDGNAGVITQSGTQISVSSNGTMLDGLTLNVTEMIKDDTVAYSWISDIMDGLCNEFSAYDIYFTDNDGNRVDITGEVTVSITTPDGYTSVQVYHIGSSTKLDIIDSKQLDGNTVFTANGFSYYVLAEKTNSGGITDPTKPANPDSPQTGDTSNMALWIALLLVSGGAVTALGVSKKQRELNTK